MEMTTVTLTSPVKTLAEEQVEAITPPFEPVEVQLPFWPGARQAFDRLLPDCLSMAFLPNENVMARDSTWMSGVCHAMYSDLGQGVAEQHHDELTHKMIEASDFGWSVIDANWFAGFLRREMSARTLHNANQMLAGVSREMQARGVATPIERIRHALGMEPMPGYPLFQVAVGTTPLVTTITDDTLDEMIDAVIYGEGDLGERQAASIELATKLNGGRKPKFGDWMRNPWAGKTNPHRDGRFVRCYGSGLSREYEMTDGKGEFWRQRGSTAIFIDRPEASELP